jgi:hypothetical protein
MRLTSLVIFGLLAVPFGNKIQGQNVTPSPETGVTPNVLLLHRADLIPGRQLDYQQKEAEIAQAYAKLKIPVYWLALSSFTGSPNVVYIDGFDSYAEVENTGDNLNAALAAHPGLLGLRQELQSFVAASNTLLAFRRDDLGYRMNKVDLAQSRFVRVTLLELRTGTDADFASAVRTVRQFYEANDVNSPWVIYQVDSGMAMPAYLQFQPMQSLKEMDDAMDRRKSEQPPFHDAVRQRLIQALQTSLVTAGAQIYSVNGEMSHLSNGQNPPEPKN